MLAPAATASAAALDRLMARGAAFFGSRVAIMGGAMSWLSERHLVAALSNAGAFGVIACGAMEPPRLAEEIAGTQALTTKPFGVNAVRTSCFSFPRSSTHQRHDRPTRDVGWPAARSSCSAGMPISVSPMPCFVSRRRPSRQVSGVMPTARSHVRR